MLKIQNLAKNRELDKSAMASVVGGLTYVNPNSKTGQVSKVDGNKWLMKTNINFWYLHAVGF